MTVDLPADAEPAARVRRATCTASYTITQADLDAGTVTNTATGHASFKATPVHSNQDSETVTAVQTPGLGLVKSADPTTYNAVGQVIGYSYMLTEQRERDAGGAVHGDGRQGDGELQPTASLLPAATATCTASYTITQADLDAGKVTNTATGPRLLQARRR